MTLNEARLRMTDSQRAKLIEAAEDKYHVAVAVAQDVMDKQIAAIGQVSDMLTKLKTVGGGYGLGAGHVKKAIQNMPFKVFTKHDISESVGHLVTLKTIAKNLDRLQKTGNIVLVKAGKGRAVHEYSLPKQETPNES